MCEREGEREMSAIYDNCERLVAAVLEKEQLWQHFHQQQQSRSPSSSSSSPDFSFSRLNSSLDDMPFGYSSPRWSVPNHKTDEHFGTKTTHSRGRNLTIQVPKLGIKDYWDFSCAPVCSKYCSIVSPTLSSRAIQESYPLPLPPTSISNSLPVSPPKLTAKLPSPQGAENVKSPRTCWKKGRLIGKGSSVDVYHGFNSEKGQMCAMKEVSLSPKDLESKKNARSLENEIALLSRINHPSIVQYYGSELVADKFYIYFEYVSGGSIDMILQQYGRFRESVISNYTQQILSGLAYLHSKSIAHRDIKGANVLVDPNGKVKLCSFAFEQHIAEQSRMSWFMDSSYWMAPEAIMNSDVPTLAVDIWSLGCTVLEMATTRPPLSQYDRGVAMLKIANHKELPQFPDHLSDVCKDFLWHCLQWNPQQRATAAQLLEHPFVKSSRSLGKQILVSTFSGHPAATNSAKSEGSDHARSPHLLDSGKVIYRASKASKSNFQTSDIYTPRNISAPVSPVGSPLPHPWLAPVSPVGSPLPHPRSTPVSPVRSPLPHPRSTPVSPVRSPLPHPRSTPVSPVGSPLPHPRSTPVSPVGSPLPHPRSTPVSPVGSPLPHPRSTPVSPVGSPLPNPRSTHVSPVGSPLPHPRSPQHLNRLMPPQLKSSPHTTPKPMINGVEASPHFPLNESLLRQDTSYNLPNKSPNISTPSYWDPNILRGVFKFT
ncbi:hypothetical protein ACS0TY_004533 [Phlomoides rotata]